MKKEGVLIVQHGDCPLDFKDEYREMFDLIQEMIEEVSRETREIRREPDDCYVVGMGKIIGSFKRIGGYQQLETGHMEFSKPTIEEAVQKLTRRVSKPTGILQAVFLLQNRFLSAIQKPFKDF